MVVLKINLRLEFSNISIRAGRMLILKLIIPGVRVVKISIYLPSYEAVCYADINGKNLQEIGHISMTTYRDPFWLKIMDAIPETK